MAIVIYVLFVMFQIVFKIVTKVMFWVLSMALILGGSMVCVYLINNYFKIQYFETVFIRLNAFVSQKMN